MEKTVKRVICSLAAAAFLSLNAGAAVVKTLYLDDMAEKSGVIVHANIVGSRSEWNASHSAIYTIYTARATQYLSGFLGETFEFRERGGVAEGVGMHAPGSPEFKAGEEVLLFLWTDGASGAYQCIGLEQGVLRVSEQDGVRVVNRSIPVRAAGGVDGAGAQTLSASSASDLRSLNATSRLLGDVLTQVSSAVARGRAQAAARREDQ